MKPDVKQVLQTAQLQTQQVRKIMTPKITHEPDESFEFAMNLLGTKWTFSILRQLLSGTKRTSALFQSLKGISPRTLAERLRNLEASRIISRRAYAEIPPRVEYSLTDMGRQASPTVEEITKLGASWRQDM